MRKFLAPLLLAAILLVVQAGASVVTSIPGGTVIPMPAVDYFGPGPQTFGPGSFAVTWSSTNAFNGGGAAFGYAGTYGPYSFVSNGQWTGAMGPMAGLNDSTDFYGSTDIDDFRVRNAGSCRWRILELRSRQQHPDHHRRVGFEWQLDRVLRPDLHDWWRQ